RRRFGLILCLPLLIRHAVDQLARLFLRHRDALFPRRFLIPVRQAVAAEAGEVHQVDILHVGTVAQMRHELAEGGRFQLRPGLLVKLGHSSPPSAGATSMRSVCEPKKATCDSTRVWLGSARMRLTA